MRSFKMRARAMAVCYTTRGRDADGNAVKRERSAHFGEVFHVDPIQAAKLLATGGAVLADRISIEALEGERQAKIAAYRAARSGHGGR